MAAAKKRAKVHARDVMIGKRTVETVLLELAEQVKENDARAAERALEHERWRVDNERRMAQIDAQSAMAQQQAALALQTIAAVTQDLRAITQELREENRQAAARFAALEKRVGIEYPPPGA